MRQVCSIESSGVVRMTQAVRQFASPPLPAYDRFQICESRYTRREGEPFP